MPFDEWIGEYDVPVRAEIRAYIDRVAVGGAHRNIKRLKDGDGVLEIRIDKGPGYRVYYGETRNTIIVLLLGGTKRTQDRDIELAKKYWRTSRETT